MPYKDFNQKSVIPIKWHIRWSFTIIFCATCLAAIRPLLVSQLTKRASAYLSFNLYGDAIREFQKALFIDKKNSDIWNWLAYSYNKRYETEKAVEGYKRALEIDPANLESYFELGMIFVRQAHYKDAVFYFEKVKKIGILQSREKETDVFSYYKGSMLMLATCYERLNEFGKAQSILEELKRRYPFDASIDERIKKLSVLQHNL